MARLIRLQPISNNRWILDTAVDLVSNSLITDTFPEKAFTLIFDCLALSNSPLTFEDASDTAVISVINSSTLFIPNHPIFKSNLQVEFVCPTRIMLITIINGRQVELIYSS